MLLHGHNDCCKCKEHEQDLIKCRECEEDLKVQLPLNLDIAEEHGIPFMFCSNPQCGMYGIVVMAGKVKFGV